MRQLIEEVLLRRIKFIGDNEQVYKGYPAHLIDELVEALEKLYVDAQS